MPLPIHEPLMDRHILLLGNLVSFCREAPDVFCISMVNLPRCTQDNKGSQRPAELRAHILSSLSYCTLGGVTQHDVHPGNPCRGFWDWQRLGLLAKGMTHGMTKLLCMSVRLGLYPTDICWLRLIQAPEKPGIRVRNRWPFFSPSLPFVILSCTKKNISNPHPVFYRLWNIIASAKIQGLFSHCSSVFSTNAPTSPCWPNLIGD